CCRTSRASRESSMNTRPRSRPRRRPHPDTIGSTRIKLLRASRFATYEKGLQHAAFLGIDVARAIQGVLASQGLHARRGCKHAIRLARPLHARGDVDRIAPDVIGELGRPDHSPPGMAGPECTPTRIGKGTGKRGRNRAVAATMSSANFAAKRA